MRKGPSSLKVEKAARDEDEVVGLEAEVVLGFAFLDDFVEVNGDNLVVGRVGAAAAGDFDAFVVGKISHSAGAHDGFAQGKDFVARDFLRPRHADFAHQIYFAPALAKGIESEDHGRVVVVVFVQFEFQLVGKLLAGFITGGESSKVRNLDFAGVGHEQGLGLVAILHDPEADAIADSNFVGVIEGIHRDGGGRGVRG